MGVYCWAAFRANSDSVYFIKRKISLSLNSTILCGPILRRQLPSELLIWLAMDKPRNLTLNLYQDETTQIDTECSVEWIKIGEHAAIGLFRLIPTYEDTWPTGIDIEYELKDDDSGFIFDLAHLSLSRSRPSFCYNQTISSVIQGSCRKPDHPAQDAFVGIYAKLQDGTLSRPDYLIMAGDQIYADDVSAPMLIGAQILAKKLNLYSATHYSDALPRDSLAWETSINKRHHILPQKEGLTRWQNFWHGSNIISARFHENHLITLDEFFATYLLTWSTSCWQMVMAEVELAARKFSGPEQKRYLEELHVVKQFVEELDRFEAVVANIPTLMIFDDHDITDDWNLTADWESHIYGNRVTKHMISDGLLSYCLFQGWGNSPERVEPLIEKLKALAPKKDFANKQLTEHLLDFNQWDYVIDTSPRIAVLDTRTQRWRSETSAKNPSGLMDWKSLEQLEDQLYESFGSILVVSAAPVFGVKAIEVVQKACELVGQELLVDVENWMAHQGSARKLMSMMRHDDAPDEIIILSGDVHYSFCFSAKRRFSSSTDKIWQLTCSGFKNEFPQKLLKVFDYIDRFLYSQYSLLNIFTKRRTLAVDHHPLKTQDNEFKHLNGRHLVSSSAAGVVELDQKGLLKHYRLVTGSGDIHEFALDE